MTLSRLGAGERAIFTGLPGFGKTNLIAWFLQNQSSVVVFDSKREPSEWASWGPRHGYVVSEDPEDISRHPLVIHQVDQRALLDREGWRRPDRIGYRWTDALCRLIARGQTRAVFDEVIQTLPAGAAHPEAVRVFTQGRAWRISCWGATQIANRMETLVPRLAEHAFSFKMVNRDDRDILARCRGVDCSVLEELDHTAYEFAYHRIGETSWVPCAAVDRVI